MTPAWAAALHPARPAVPWLAARWDTGVGAVAAYRARWEPAAIPGGSIAGRVLGSRVSEGQAAERSEAGWLVGDVWAGATRRMLAVHARSADGLTAELRSVLLSPPPWLQGHLRELGAAGALAAGVPVAQLASLYGDVAAFRQRWGRDIADDADLRGLRSLLGSRSDEPLARRQWDVLAGRTADLGAHRQRTRARSR